MLRTSALPLSLILPLPWDHSVKSAETERARERERDHSVESALLGHCTATWRAARGELRLGWPSANAAVFVQEFGTAAAAAMMAAQSESSAPDWHITRSLAIDMAT